MDSQRLMEDEHYAREESYRECREDLEGLRSELEDVKRELMNESVKREQAEGQVQTLETVIGSMSRDMQLLKDDRDVQAESAANLQAVLDEFQAGSFWEFSRPPTISCHLTSGSQQHCSQGQ